MSLRSFRPLMLALMPVALTASMSPGPAAADTSANASVVGVDLGSSGRPQPSARSQSLLSGDGHAMPSRDKGEMQIAHEGQPHAEGAGTINAVDAAAHKINLSHGPIAGLGWPAMTMEFPVAPAVDLRALKPGMKVDFTIEQGQAGPVIQSVAPAAGGR